MAFGKKNKKSVDEELDETLAKLRKLEAEDKIRELEKEKNSGRNDLLMFLAGLLMFGGGLFMILQQLKVDDFGTPIYHIGSWGVPNGMIMLPLLIGIIMLFIMDKKIFGWIVVGLGIVFLLLSVIMSIRFDFSRTSAFNFILMFGLTAAGGAMLLKVLFTKK